jgi:hypothetical protein
VILLLAAAVLLQPMKPQEVVHPPDHALAVWTWDSGLGGTMPDLIQTVRWTDGDLAREQVFGSENVRLGLVEAVERFESNSGPVYVIVGEDEHTTTEFAVVLTAWRIRHGKATLEPATGFFAGVPGVRFDDDSTLQWQYTRVRGPADGAEVFPRPIEVRLDEAAKEIRVSIFPDAERERARKTPLAKMKRREFTLAMKDGVLTAVGLDAGDRGHLEKPYGADQN